MRLAWKIAIPLFLLLFVAPAFAGCGRGAFDADDIKVECRREGPHVSMRYYSDKGLQAVKEIIRECAVQPIAKDR